jgi:hypothetical protein
MSKTFDFKKLILGRNGKWVKNSVSEQGLRTEFWIEPGQRKYILNFNCTYGENVWT